MEAEAQRATAHTARTCDQAARLGMLTAMRSGQRVSSGFHGHSPRHRRLPGGPAGARGHRGGRGGAYLAPAGGAGAGPSLCRRRGGGGAYLALAEGGAVVDLVAAGALAQGLAATVHTGLLQEDRVSVVGTLPRDTEEGLVTGTRPTRISCPCLTDSEQEAGGWITYRPTLLQTAGISLPPRMQKANLGGPEFSGIRTSP